MESVRRWVSKFRTQDKHKSSKKESATNGKEGSKALTTEEAPSNDTKQKVAAAKQYIEKHYKEQMKNLQERKERYDFCTSSHNEQSNYLTCHAYITYITNSYCVCITLALNHFALFSFKRHLYGFAVIRMEMLFTC